MSERSALRTTLRDRRSSREISRMLLCSLRKSRRILAMVSTISIPGWPPGSDPPGAWDRRCRGGSRLDADQPLSRVLFPRRFPGFGLFKGEVEVEDAEIAGTFEG